MPLQRNRLLAEQLKDEIIEMLRNGDYSSPQLPSEAELSRRFEVSLTTVREALTMMRLEGLITKKHGSGNYFHKSILDINNRIDQYPGFNKYLEAQGYKVRQIVSPVIRKPVPEDLAAVLDLEAGEEAAAFTSAYLADGVPAIFSEYYLSLKNLKTDIPKKLKPPVTIYGIMADYYSQPYAYAKVEYLPLSATEAEKEQINAEPGTPLVAMCNTYYTSYDNPIIFGYHKFNHDYVKLVMITIH